MRSAIDHLAGTASRETSGDFSSRMFRLALCAVLALLGVMAATPACADWLVNGVTVSPHPGAVAGSDGRGGLYGFVGYPLRFPIGYRLDVRGDAPMPWTPAGIELTPGMTPLDHGSIEPSVALPDGDGGVYVLAREQWPYTGHGGALDPFRFHIHRRDATGARPPGWGPDGVALGSPWLSRPRGIGLPPALVDDGLGGVLFGRLALEEVALGGLNLVVQRVNQNGALLWGPEGLEIVRSLRIASVPALISDGRGGALVFWAEWDSSGTRISIRGQRVLQSGDLGWEPGGRRLLDRDFDRLSGSVPFGGPPNWRSYEPAIAATPDGVGGALLAWAGSEGADMNVYALPVRHDGRAGYDVARIVCGAAGEQATVRSVAMPGGGAVVAWRDGRRGSDVGIYAQRLDRLGRPRWTHDGIAVRNSPGERSALALHATRSGGVYVAWSDTIGGNHIRASRLTPDGRIALGCPTDGWVVSLKGYPASRVGLSIVESGRASAIVAWSDAGWGSLAMRVTPRGPALGQLTLWEEHLEELDIEPADDITDGDLRLHDSRPNPASGAATIGFDLASDEPAILELVDLAGRRVWARDIRGLGAGAHTVSIADGVQLPGGIYFARLVQSGRSASRRIVWTR